MHASHSFTSSFRQIVPEAVAALLAQHNVRTDDLLLATTTDIDFIGGYQTTWLVVTKDRLDRKSVV